MIIIFNIINNKTVIENKSETKRKLTESELDNEHEKMAKLTEELGTLMYEYSTLQRQFNDTTEVQEKIDEKFKEAIISKIPTARLGEPEDIANAVLFLASDQSNYINGETIHINGGMYMA